MFGKRLRELREKKGYSMDTLIDLYNNKFDGKMNKSTLSRYENELQEPIYTVVVNLSKIFDVSVDYISCADKSTKIQDEKNINPDIRMIARAGKKMTKEQSETLRKYAEFMFPEAFKDDSEQ